MAEIVLGALLESVISALINLALREASKVDFKGKFKQMQTGILCQELRERITVGHDGQTVTLLELVSATGNFCNKKKIGSGSLGTVYVAEVPRNRKVAVKRFYYNLREKIHNLKDELVRFKCLAHHENVIKLLDVHMGEGVQLLVYEFMEHKSLEDALFDRSKSLIAWETRLRICVGVAKALKHLHEYPQGSIVHGNIKPSNIFLHGDGGVKVSDFGLMSVDADQCELLYIAASRGFSPIECFQGDISTKSDVYSFGMILLVIVSGRKAEADRIPNQETEFLLDRAHYLRGESRLSNLVDKRLRYKYNERQALTILHLAMECTHVVPAQRPTISEALSVLEGEIPLSQIIQRNPAISDIYLEEKAADPDPSTLEYSA